jgi:hypothetical protein
MIGAFLLLAGCDQPYPAFISDLDANLIATSVAPADEFEYFPSMTVILSQPVTSKAKADRAFSDFIVQHALGDRSEWTGVRKSKHYFFIDAQDHAGFGIIYVRHQDVHVRYFSPR